FNNGNTSATGVALDDATPEHTSVVPGSATTDRGTVDSEDPLTVTVGEIAGGMDVVTVTFQVAVDSPIAAGVMAVVNQALVHSAELPDLLSDDPEAGGDADPTETQVQAEPDLTVDTLDVLFADLGRDGIASPGDVLRYQLTVHNDGNTGATALGLRDQIPANTVLDAGSVQTSQGTVSSVDPIEIALGQVNV
ncbi:MAG: DUF11 domain-containing protein, partial [bacterium]|nr:DUF11 domain-containing protein [bacterium]